MTAFEEEKIFLQFIIEKSSAVLEKKAIMIQPIAFESIIKTEVFRCCGCFSVTSTLTLSPKLFYFEKNKKKKRTLGYGSLILQLVFTVYKIPP